MPSTEIIDINIETEEDALRELSTLLPSFQEQGLRIGRILSIVQEKKLYRGSFRSIEGWLEAHFGISRSRGYQLINYANFVDSTTTEEVSYHTNLSTRVDSSVSRLTNPPVTEKQARVLKKVPESKRAEVIENAASANGTITAPALEASAKAILNKEPAPEEPEKECDTTGWVIPELIVPLFHQQEAVQELQQKVGVIRGVVRRLMEAYADPKAKHNPIFAECNFHDMLNCCDTLHQQFKLAIPFAVCPYCHGVPPIMKMCQACLARGVMSQFKWNNCVPEEMKVMRQKAIEDLRRK